MKKTEVPMTADNNTVRATGNASEQSADERYESMLYRIRASLVACQMITEDLNALYKELKAFHKNPVPGGAK